MFTHVFWVYDVINIVIWKYIFAYMDTHIMIYLYTKHVYIYHAYALFIMKIRFGWTTIYVCYSRLKKFSRVLEDYLNTRGLFHCVHVNDFTSYLEFT